MYYHCHCNEILWNTSIVVHINILLSELYVQYCTYNVLSEVGTHFYISFCCAISIFAFQRIVRTTNCKAVLSHPHHAIADFSRQRRNAASFLEWGGGGSLHANVKKHQICFERAKIRSVTIPQFIFAFALPSHYQDSVKKASMPTSVNYTLLYITVH